MHKCQLIHTLRSFYLSFFPLICLPILLACDLFSFWFQVSFVFLSFLRITDIESGMCPNNSFVLYIVLMLSIWSRILLRGYVSFWATTKAAGTIGFEKLLCKKDLLFNMFHLTWLSVFTFFPSFNPVNPFLCHFMLKEHMVLQTPFDIFYCGNS